MWIALQPSKLNFNLWSSSMPHWESSLSLWKFEIRELLQSWAALKLGAKASNSYCLS